MDCEVVHFMKSLLQKPFPAIITKIPVQQHSILLEAGFWKPKFSKKKQTELFDAIFGNKPHIHLTRDRLLNYAYANQVQKCTEILLWGYPRNQRGRVTNLLPDIQKLQILAASNEIWPNYFDAFAHIPNINISTITKLAYFYRRPFDGHNALILDSRLIKNINFWEQVAMPELQYQNAKKYYCRYLAKMHDARHFAR
jgi:Putative 8-oxoguanine DNA glycosylase OGG-like protein